MPIHPAAKGLAEKGNGRIGGWKCRRRNENNTVDDGESKHSAGQNSAGTTEETTREGKAEYWQQCRLQLILFSKYFLVLINLFSQKIYYKII